MHNGIEIFKQISIDNENEINIDEIKSIIESLLFTSGEALSIDEISSIVEINKSALRKILNDMINEYTDAKRGIKLLCFNNKYQLCTKNTNSKYIKKLLKNNNKQSLSKAALETIAIIAYKQPITRQKIDMIRGVKSDSVLISLIDKKLIRESGRLEVVGRPILYETTDEFLKYFGLNNLDELPSINIEKLNDFEI